MKKLPKGGAGFTLVEVAMSLGIISFGMVALIGILPTGMTASRDSRNATLTTEIVKAISNTAQQTDYSQLSTQLDGARFYFDNEGISVASTDANKIYEAVVATGTNSTVPASPQPVPLAGLTAIRINVHQALSGTNAATGQDYTVYVANNGR